MPIGIAFWVLMIIWPVVGWVVATDAPPGYAWRWRGIFLLIWVLLFLLGWKVFGFVLQGPQ